MCYRKCITLIILRRIRRNVKRWRYSDKNFALSLKIIIKKQEDSYYARKKVQITWERI
jgi:hypothetical protein